MNAEAQTRGWPAARAPAAVWPVRLVTALALAAAFVPHLVTGAHFLLHPTWL